MAGRKRNACITMQATTEERNRLRAAADKVDLPLSVFIRTLALMALESGETLAIVKTVRTSG
jgi:hypothetical protein